MTDENEVLFERRGAVGLITLNRPKALNALTHGMCLSMKAQLDEWAVDAAVKTVVVRGAGERAFCAGGDIRALYDSGRAGTPYALDFYRDEYILDAAIRHFPKPYVALIRGIVMGGGVGVSLNGSHRIADESTMFAMPETGIGLFPDVGGSYFLPRLPGEAGMYLALTGARLKTADCVYAGIATHFVLAEGQEHLIEALAKGETPDDMCDEFSEWTDMKEGWKAGRIPHENVKPGHLSVVENEPAPAAPLSRHRFKIDSIFSANSVEDILRRLDDDGGEWAVATAAGIRTKSPTSLKLAFRQLREGRKLDFDDCMRMEFRMVNRVIAGHDFYEGVRATIIDKDQSPKWNPASLEAVSDADIDAYFAPLGEKELKL